MFALTVGGLLALVAFLACSFRGYVLRGLVSGALILALGGAEILLELTGAVHKHVQGTAYLLAGVAVVLQLVVCGVAVSKQAKPGHQPRKRR